MSFRNFVPIAESAKIQKELDRQMVFLENCNTEFEGDVKEFGDTVKILNAGKPTIYEHNDGKIHSHASEDLEGSAFFLPIKQVAQAHFGIGDIDKQIARGNLYSVYLEETKTGFGDVMDKFIAAKAADPNVEKYAPSTAVSASNVLDYIDYCKVWLEENDVKPSTEISLVGSPKFCDFVRKAYIAKGIDKATEHLQNGEITRYNNMIIKQSNNVYTATESGTDYEYIQVKTNKAIAFVKPLLKLEPYRNHPMHRDELAAFVYYDGAVVRPKEIITLKVKYA